MRKQIKYPGPHVIDISLVAALLLTLKGVHRKKKKSAEQNQTLHSFVLLDTLMLLHRV